MAKDERKLLRAYYLKITTEKGLQDVTQEKWYIVSDLVGILRSRNLKKAAKELPDYDVGDSISSNNQNECNIEDSKKEIKEYLHYRDKVNVANNTLEKRELISIRYTGQGSASGWRGVRLKMNGYELGRKYNGWYYKTGGLWWAEYKGHWIWAVVGAIVSFILGWFLRGKS